MPKRLFDVVAALAGLTLLAVPLLVAALWIVLTSPGPVFFLQERVGLAGRRFHIVKLRTMRHGGAAGPAVTAAGDARITPVGAVLRRFKIDELPQLMNVLAGQMSIVGPRPEVPAYVALWPASQRDVILSVRPGITDPASIRFRNEAEVLARYPDPDAAYRDIVMPEKLALYVDYVRGATFAGDIALIARTIASLGR